MRSLGTAVVVMLALVGAVATMQELRGQGTAPLAAGNFLHVGIVVKDIAKASQMFADVYGVTPPAPREFDNVKALRSPTGASGSQVAKAKLVQFTVGNVRVELIEPTEGVTPWQDHLDKYGPSVHHLSFGVPDIEQALRVLEAKGGTWVMGEPGNMSFKYVDMRDHLGYTVELGRQQPPAAVPPAQPTSAR
jgi:catechol 2,3-dioxygenase-like lactoylglutathione lyase family enzyme